MYPLIKFHTRDATRVTVTSLQTAVAAACPAISQPNRARLWQDRQSALKKTGFTLRSQSDGVLWKIDN